jgi:tetraacyldisaccharide 4'-kinase
VAVFAGIGNPQGFLHTVQSLGMHVATGCWFDDHHLYKVPEDFENLARVSRERNLEAWVTTLKDWVKLNDKKVGGGVPIWHVRIEARLSPHEHELLRSKLGTLG